MGKHYTHMSLEERIELYALKRMGFSDHRIADCLGRSPSTIGRELKRNSKPTKRYRGGYRPERANRLALRRRRWNARFKLARQPELADLVHDRLAMGWSPQQIAGRLALDKSPMRISHESIYRYIYHLTDQKTYWHKLLPQKKYRRGRSRRGGGPLNHIRDRVSIDKRPERANQRRQFGHWESDLMLFSRYGQAILVLHERKCRLIRIWQQPSKAAQPVVDQLRQAFVDLPPALRRSVTFDNGTEFFFHHQLNTDPGMKTYFCDIGSPWQKGGVENAISRLRRTLPRKTDLRDIELSDLEEAASRYNNTPRKCLGYKTPLEVYNRIHKRVALQP